jgi:hypothetical protein
MKKSLATLIVIAVAAVLVMPVLAAGQGLIRLDPHGSYYGMAVMQSSPATFGVYVESGPDALDPHLLLVITEATYAGLGSVTVDGVPVTTWNGPVSDNGVKLPPGCESGADYTVAALKDHLGTDGPIYWAFVPFLGGAPITQDPTEFEVTLDSSDPEMRLMLYALGKSEMDGLFSNKVPPTQPGFVVPELATVLLSLSSISALALYAVIRKRKAK